MISLAESLENVHSTVGEVGLCFRGSRDPVLAWDSYAEFLVYEENTFSAVIFQNWFQG